MARQRDHQKREKILESSIILFSQKGYHATSIQDIVSESGLSVGTIYLYFQNKEEIFNALLESGLEKFTDALFQDSAAELPTEELVERLVTIIIEAISQNIALVSVVTNEMSFQHKIQAFYTRIAEAVSKRYLGNSDVDGFYRAIKMNRQEFFSLVTILVSGLSYAMRFASGTEGELMRVEDIRFIVRDVILKSVLGRIES